MRVLYICADPGIPYWGIKGASIHVRSFTNALAAAGHEVHVVVARLGSPDGAGSPPVAVTEIPMEDEAFYEPPPDATLNESTLLYEARQFAQNRALQDVVNDLLARGDFNLICERYALFSIAGRESARWHNLPFVLEVNAPLVEEAQQHRHLVLHPLARSIERYLFSAADCIVPVSAPLGDYVRSTVPGANVVPIPNGVLLENFELAGEAESWRNEWTAGDKDAFVLGFVGSLKPWHGIEILLQSFAEIHAHDAKSRLAIVGGGPERTTIEGFVAEHGLEQSVFLTGPISHEHIPGILGGMDVLVAPYPAMDSFYFSPLKLFEYMAAGKPIVASAIGQIHEIIQDGVSGLLIPPGDANALAEQVLRLRHDPSLCDRLGGEARRIAFASHGWAHRVRSWDALVFQQLCTTRSPELAR
jgi:glycosyltransferase involved in cell wall biosynthesis